MSHGPGAHLPGWLARPVAAGGGKARRGCASGCRALHVWRIGGQTALGRKEPQIRHPSSALSAAGNSTDVQWLRECREGGRNVGMGMCWEVAAQSAHELMPRQRRVGSGRDMRRTHAETSPAGHYLSGRNGKKRTYGLPRVVSPDPRSRGEKGFPERHGESPDRFTTWKEAALRPYENRLPRPPISTREGYGEPC